MEIKYENKIVAFIDVLGFSSLVYSKTTEEIQNYFEYVTEEFTEDLVRFNFGYYLISDSVVIYTQTSTENFEALVRTVVKLQMKLITRGIIVRGGISTGNLYVNSSKNIIVGPGLINAYKLEGQAIFPRIIIDRSMIPLFYSSTSQMIKGNQGRITITPPSPYLPDFPYIDYTYKLAIVMQPPKLKIVADLLRDNLHSNSNVEKYLWLIQHIMIGFKAQLKYLEKKTSKNIRDKKRIKLITEFIDQIKEI